MIKEYLKKGILFLFLALSFKVVAFTDEEWIDVPMCGATMDGSNPCGYIKKVVFVASAPFSTKEQSNYLNRYVEEWISRNKKRFVRGVDITFKDNRGKIRENSASGDTAKVGVRIYKIKSAAIVTLSTETEKTTQIFSYFCDSYVDASGLSKCLHEKIDKGINFLMSEFITENN